MRSTSSRRSDASTSRRRLRGSPMRRGAAERLRSSQTRPALVKTYGRSSAGMSRSARATISSEWPSPYTAAVSIQLMPRSTAWRIAAIESASSWFPQAKVHPPPPIAHAPKPTRVIRMPVVPTGAVGSVSVSRTACVICALLSDAFCRRLSIVSARPLKSDGLMDLSASISSRLSWRPCRSSHTNTPCGFCSNASRNSSSVRSLPIRISTLCCVMSPCASLCQRPLGGRGGELVDDRFDGLLELLLVLLLVVRNRCDPLATPQQVFGLGVEHIDDHGSLGVLGHHRAALHSPVPSPTPSPTASPTAPPVRLPRVAVVPGGDVELLIGARVVGDAEVGVTVGRDVAEARKLLRQVGTERPVRDRVHEHRVVGRCGHARDLRLGGRQNPEGAQPVKARVGA